MVIRELEWVRNLYLGFILSVFPLLISMLTCFICAYIINLHSSSYKSRTEVQMNIANYWQAMFLTFIVLRNISFWNQLIVTIVVKNFMLPSENKFMSSLLLVIYALCFAKWIIIMLCKMSEQCRRISSFLWNACVFLYWLCKMNFSNASQNGFTCDVLLLWCRYCCKHIGPSISLSTYSRGLLNLRIWVAAL